jgi:hypothetical protein
MLSLFLSPLNARKLPARWATSSSRDIGTSRLAELALEDDVL